MTSRFKAARVPAVGKNSIPTAQQRRRVGDRNPTQDSKTFWYSPAKALSLFSRPNAAASRSTGQRNPTQTHENRGVGA